jgi:hypothetical protein
MTKKKTPGRSGGKGDASLLKVRFDATIHKKGARRDADWATALNLDRVPDPKGRIRALIDVEDLVRLLDGGYEVRLYHAHPHGPLDPELIEDDESFQTWVDEQLSGLKDRPMPTPFVASEEK